MPRLYNMPDIVSIIMKYKFVLDEAEKYLFLLSIF